MKLLCVENESPSNNMFDPGKLYESWYVDVGNGISSLHLKDKYGHERVLGTSMRFITQGAETFASNDEKYAYFMECP